VCHIRSTDRKIDYVHHSRNGDHSTLAPGQQAESTDKARQQKKNAVRSMWTRKSVQTTQISSGVSNTTVTLERFRPHVSFRTSTTSELTCKVKFLITCFRMSECTLQGYNGVTSALYMVSPGACNSLERARWSRSGSKRTTNRGS